MDPHPTLAQDLWDQTPPAVRAYIETLEGQVQTLTSMIDTLQEQVRALQEQVTETSRNSSRPPSSDPPQSPRPSRPHGQHRWGGQPGHLGQMRPLVPVDEVDEVVVLKPDQCSGCQAPLSGDDASPFRHQVMEIPPLKPVITEYQWHQLVCPACGATTRAPWPDGVASRTYGPRVQATVALCTGAYRLSKRTTQQALEEIFGIPMSVATVSQLEQAMTAVLVAPVEEAQTYVHEQAVAHLDETSWRQGDKRGWLWVAVTSWVTVFLVRLSRGGDIARALLGEPFAGILVTDRYSAYNLSSAMASALLGAFASRFCRDAEPWWSLRGVWCGLAGPSAPDVCVVASGAREHAQTIDLSLLHDPAPPRGGAAVGKRQPV
jgi:transposase